jgi:hypothetical protein
MKFVAARPFADPEPGAQVLEIANVTEAVQDGRIYIERINGRFSLQAAVRMSSWLRSIARSEPAGSGGMNPEPV